MSKNEEKDLLKIISAHEEALKAMQERADLATTALVKVRSKAIQEQLAYRRPGQAAVAFLEPDPEMERLEKERVQAAGSVYTLEKKLEQLRRMLAAEQAKQ